MKSYTSDTSQHRRPSSSKPKAPPLKYHGSKFALAPWLIANSPPSAQDDPAKGYTHRNIVFAGGLGELWGWEPVEGISESVNDVQGILAAFWDVMRSPDLFDRFERYLLSTPFSAQEFRKQKEVLEVIDLDEDDEDPELLLAAAIAFYIVNRQSRQGLGKDYVVPTRRTRRGRNEHVSAWASAVDNLPWFHDRMLRVEVNRLDFREYLAKYDHERALFFCDPPYLHSTRVAKQAYGDAEMTDADHQDLLKILGKIRGRFMLCGYDSDLYSHYAIEHKWRVVSKTVSCPSSSKKAKDCREEFLWMNY